MIYLNDVPSTLELAKWIRTINNIHNHLTKKLRLTEDPTKPNIKVGSQLILLKRPYPPFGRKITFPETIGLVTVEEIRGRAIIVRHNANKRKLTVSVDRLRLPKPDLA